MSEEIKALLCALIDGLAIEKSYSQYDEGEKIINDKGIKLLKEAIRRL